MRLIDADVLKHTLCELERQAGFGTVRDSLDGFKLLIDKALTVDAVPVVRCRDCEYYVETNGRIGTCELTISGAEDDGFCAWGERKNNADY